MTYETIITSDIGILESMRQRLSEGHPQIMVITDEIRDLRRQIEELPPEKRCDV